MHMCDCAYIKQYDHFLTKIVNIVLKQQLCVNK